MLLAVVLFTLCGALRIEAKEPATPPANAQLVAEFSVRDLAKSRAFYEALGFKVTHTEKTFLELQWSDGHKLFISESKDAGPVPEKPVINIRIGVEKVDDHWKKAQELKAKVIAPVGDRFYGNGTF
jgi:catechol 2,3-dioxygenase-like lactoylglutathione lyase family enzyme